MRTRRHAVLGTAFCLAAATFLPAALAAQESERKVSVETHVRCEEGQDCAKSSHKVLVSPGGEVKVLKGDGGLVWLGRPGELAREALAGLQWTRGAFLGVQLTDLTADLRRHFGVPEDQGVLVASVVEDSAAARAGIEVGDIVTAVDGEPIASAASLGRAVGKREAGATVQIELWRDGRLESFSATLDEPTSLPRKTAARVFVRCDGDECEHGDEPSMFFFGGDDLPGSFDCGVGDDGEAIACAVEVRCEGSECTCTVNGEERVCDELDGVKTIRLRKQQQQQ